MMFELRTQSPKLSSQPLLPSRAPKKEDIGCKPYLIDPDLDLVAYRARLDGTCSGQPVLGD